MGKHDLSFSQPIGGAAAREVARRCGVQLKPRDQVTCAAVINGRHRQINIVIHHADGLMTVRTVRE